jgi:predicted DsbA family dithiol-disulfide isomerase
LGIFLEWGPARSIDVRVRIKKALPALRPAEIKKLEAEFWELMSAACRIVEENVERHQSEDDARIKVAALDPRVSPENASNLYSQARYSAWRDGYR